eukprot:scaffold31559_cov32-Tisochrysis_lutea.AAC.5
MATAALLAPFSPAHRCSVEALAKLTLRLGDVGLGTGGRHHTEASTRHIGEAHVIGGEVATRHEEDAKGRRGYVLQRRDRGLEQWRVEAEGERTASRQRRVGAERVCEASRHGVYEHARLLGLQRYLVVAQRCQWSSRITRSATGRAVIWAMARPRVAAGVWRWLMLRGATTALAQQAHSGTYLCRPVNLLDSFLKILPPERLGRVEARVAPAWQAHGCVRAADGQVEQARAWRRPLPPPHAQGLPPEGGGGRTESRLDRCQSDVCVLGRWASGLAVSVPRAGCAAASERVLSPSHLKRHRSFFRSGQLTPSAVR